MPLGISCIKILLQRSQEDLKRRGRGEKTVTVDMRDPTDPLLGLDSHAAFLKSEYKLTYAYADPPW